LYGQQFVDFKGDISLRIAVWVSAPQLLRSLPSVSATYESANSITIGLLSRRSTTVLGKTMRTTKKAAAKEPDLTPAERNKLITLYEGCVQNAQDLFEEAHLLARHAKYSRALFLAITAYEEMGKAQLVADYAANSLSKPEFEDAFRYHTPKAAYMMRYLSAPPFGPTRSTKTWSNSTICYDLHRAKPHIEGRQRALYVGYRDRYDDLVLPSQITKDQCDAMFESVQKAFHAIEHAERMNGPIGSKGLFK
jgi:AbiV family abortive infection protein